jgi:4-amino-4-deoxy-L-arabinose transferase-like glycosyltransferase
MGSREKRTEDEKTELMGTGKKPAGTSSLKQAGQAVLRKERGSGFPFTMTSKGFYLFLFLLAFVVWYGFYATHTKGVTGSDDREYASIARNIVEGKGIVRNSIYPIDINFFSKPPISEFHHPPGYPLILAAFFKVFGISDGVALLPSYFSYFLLLLLLLCFMKKRAELKTAALAGILIIFNKELLDVSLVALTEIVYSVVFFTFFVVLANAKTPRAVFVAGLLLGVSQLIRKSFYPFLVPLFVYFFVYHRDLRWKKMGLFTVGLLRPLLPFWIRSYLATGSPFFSYNHLILMSYSDKYPEMQIWRDIDVPSLLELLKDEPGMFLSKYLTHFMNLLSSFLSVSNSYMLAFFLAEMFYWRVDPDWKRIKILLLLLFFSQVLFIPLHTFEARYFIPFLPMIAAFASQGISRTAVYLIAEMNSRWKTAVTGFLALLFFMFFSGPTVYLILRPTGPSIIDRKTLQFGFFMLREDGLALNEFLNRELKKDQIVWTDVPEVLPWEGNRPGGWLPLRIKTIYKIHEKIPVDAILLTNVQTPHRMKEEWRYLMVSEHSLPQYRTVKLYQKGYLLAKLLIRDEKD